MDWQNTLKAAKVIDSAIIQDIGSRIWVPFQVVSGALFPGLDNIPSNLVHAVYASGNLFSGSQYSSSVVSSGELIGRAEVYRLGIGDPVTFNKDVYGLVRIPSSGLMFYADGPYRDHEHWINDIPERLSGAEIYVVSKSYT